MTDPTPDAVQGRPGAQQEIIEEDKPVAATAPKKAAGKRAAADAAPASIDESATVQATIPAELKARIQERARLEDRTESVVVKRLLTAGMKDWTPEDAAD